MNLISDNRSPNLRILVLGYIVRCPLGGMAWHHLQYVLGLKQLGHDVYFFEDSGDDPWACYDPQRNVNDKNPSYGLNFISHTFEKVGLTERWTYHDVLGSQWYGPASELVEELLTTADLLLNLSGSNVLRPWFLKIPRKVFIDTDPVFTQLRHLNEPSRLSGAMQHNAFFSFGENIGKSHCTIPDDGIAWKTTRQPVVLDAWPVTPPKITGGKFTTVMQWDNTLQNVPRDYKGHRYGRKSDSFEPYMALPQRTSEQLELALAGDAPRNELRKMGWLLCNPLEVTQDPWTYQKYIQESKGEFSVAKHGYWVTNSGWFSERTACYLATGRPVVVQETGFSTWLSTGIGVIPFTTAEDACEAFQEINARYVFHCEAARALAEYYFDSRKVLNNLIEEVLASDGKLNEETN
jgi:hypothetical protein